ncbi:MAG TPA: chemotaxis-specific protein-glutamate methyltransferase CheB [Thermoanaerobaculia bacterium]|nr:chemotaxis-specific protein-glutamate methyltransferase CheB [Thermoanaerobaculia bacterium]
MKIGIVNDVKMIGEALRRILTSQSDHRVAWVAYDGAQAVEKAISDPPDLILMDLMMPVMDGVEATNQIMQKAPCAILVVTATVMGNSPQVFRAMGFGALDAVNTPGLAPADSAVLLGKIDTIGRLLGKKGGKVEIHEETAELTSNRDLPRLVAIAASTGGPKALAEVLSNLPSPLDAAVVVIQHVDVQFSEGLANWLQDQSKMTVEVAREGARPVANKVLVAGTNDHLTLSLRLTLHYTPQPLDNPYRPSADVFFRSVAEHWPHRGTAAVLTGMGNDGAEGLLLLRERGWHTIAQNEQTSIIYGMPRAAAEAGAAVEVLPLDRIARSIAEQTLRRSQLTQPVRRGE